MSLKRYIRDEEFLLSKKGILSNKDVNIKDKDEEQLAKERELQKYVDDYDKKNNLKLFSPMKDNDALLVDLKSNKQKIDLQEKVKQLLAMKPRYKIREEELQRQKELMLSKKRRLTSYVKK